MRLMLVWLGAAAAMMGQMDAQNIAVPDAAELKRMAARLTPTRLTASELSGGERAALAKLVEAARVFDQIFLRQIWSGNEELQPRLQEDTTPLGKERLRLFLMYKGRGRIWMSIGRSCRGCRRGSRQVQISIPRT